MHPLALPLAMALAADPAVPVRSPEGDLFAMPSLLDDHGNALGRSTYRQWVRRGEVHVELVHRLAAGTRVVERARFRQGASLAQRAWSWEERRGGALLRRYEVDFAAGRARAVKVGDHGEEERWDEAVDVDPGSTFAGIGVAYAAKNLRDRAAAGGDATIRGVVFLPKPLSVPLRVKLVRKERIRVGGADLDADRLAVRPDLHGAEKLLDAVKDPAGTDVWVLHGTPPMLLRVRFPLAEARDRTVVVETLGTPERPRAAARRPSGR